jgi:hypothetical protein
MGMVYDAVHTFTHGRVALKVLHTRRHAPRMVAEARTLAAIDHPSIVRIFDAGAAAVGCAPDARQGAEQAPSDHARGGAAPAGGRVVIALTPFRVARVFMACKGKPLMFSRAAEKVARLAERHEALGRQLHYLADALHEQRHVELVS